MGWVKLDDQRAMNKKLRQAGFEARGLDEAAICQVSADMTDGFIAEETVEMLAAAHRCRNWRKLAAVLCDVGRWEDAPGGWVIHDYLEYNPTKAQWEETVNKKKAAGKRGGQASASARGAAVASPPARAPGKASGAAAAQRSGQAVPSRPVPSRDISQSSSTLQQPASGISDDDDDPIIEALRILAERDLEDRIAAKGPVARTDLWLTTAYQNRVQRHADELADLAGLSAAEIVDRLEPPGGTVAEDPGDTLARAAAEQRRRQSIECSECDNTGWAGGDPANGKCPCGRLMTAAELAEVSK